MRPTRQEHVQQLADAFEVRLIISPLLKPEEAMAIPAHRLVLAAPIHEDLGYAVVLHELGHLASPTGALQGVTRTPRVLLTEEEAAWNWARHYALDWTASMEGLARWAMSTYEDHPAPAPRGQLDKPAKPQQQIDWTKWKR